ncbi:MAG: DUF2807 domain-containing protein [Saprospiraceae bacterium]|nr:DUF2807 domain-containing protein [Saprospiraceae bacterium]
MTNRLIRTSFLFTFALLFCASFTLNAQWNKGIKGSGNVIEQNRNLSGFQNVKASSGIDVVIMQGSQDKVVVKADDNLADKITTRVDGNTLVLAVERNSSIRNAKSFKVLVTASNLKAIMSSGGSDVYSEGVIKADALNIKATGGSDVKMELAVKELTCNVSGGSDANLKGKAQYMTITALGGSDFEGKNLTAENCKLKVQGGSDAYVYVTGEISMEAHGASDIHYRGSPKVTYQKSSGGSDIYGN